MPTKAPRISIVTPSFNQRRFVEQTIRSVLLQRYPDIEYIVLDGGSTDGSEDVLRKYAPYLAYWRSAPDGGQAAAVAEGLARATGDILCYVNSDDLIAPDAFYQVASFFAEHPEIDAVYSHRCIIDDKGRIIGFWILPDHSNWTMERWAMIPQETCFWRRHLMERAGSVDPSFAFALDYDLFVRFMRAGRFVRLNRFLGAFRDHLSSKTRTELGNVGRREIEQIRSRYGIRISPSVEMIGHAISLYVQIRGGRYARGRRPRGGAVPVLGFDYDRMWGGLLRSDEMPPRPADARPVGI